jgi:carbonic anhydrase
MNLDTQSPLTDEPAGEDSGRITRRSLLRSSVVIGASVPLGAWGLSACGDSSSSTSKSSTSTSSTSTSPSSSEGRTEDLVGLTPDQALQKLKEGNDRFVAMKHTDPNLSSKRRVSVAAGQHPFAGVIGCIDSRVPPELVFDRGLGDLFVGRVGAAIADDSQIGGMEFGVLEFSIPLLVVLGHERCGAVKATIEAMEKHTDAPGQIGAVVRPIIPAVKAAEDKKAGPAELLDQSVRESVKISVAALQKSPVLKGLISSGKLKVVGARYDLDTGRVDILE